jgi:tRNA dimethylallyltransferase
LTHSSPSPAPFFLLGPTAVGKSEIAADLAEHCGGEIVGGDAFQIYRGLDLLTAKPDAATLGRVPHHLIGEVPPSECCDAARYAEMAGTRIIEITARGLRPIVVGGTGFYIRALTHGLPELPAANEALRSQLAAQPLAVLVARLAALDPESAAAIDRQNPRRVIRALEVCLLTGRPFSSFQARRVRPRIPLQGVILERDRADLAARIDARTEAMFAAGVVEEGRGAGPLSATAEQVIGLREIRELLAGKITRDDCIRLIQIRTRQYAKRQATWFARDTDFTRLNLSHFTPTQILRQLRALLSSPVLKQENAS